MLIYGQRSQNEYHARDYNREELKAHFIRESGKEVISGSEKMFGQLKVRS